MAKRTALQMTGLSLLFLISVGCTTAVGINDVNSGIYADKYGLGGGKVGWFHGAGVPVFAVLALISVIVGLYLLEELLNRFKH